MGVVAPGGGVPDPGARRPQRLGEHYHEARGVTQRYYALLQPGVPYIKVRSAERSTGTETPRRRDRRGRHGRQDRNGRG